MLVAVQSSNTDLIAVPQLSLALSAKAFCVSGPTVWNSLPIAVSRLDL